MAHRLTALALFFLLSWSTNALAQCSTDADCDSGVCVQGTCAAEGSPAQSPVVIVQNTSRRFSLQKGRQTYLDHGAYQLIGGDMLAARWTKRKQSRTTLMVTGGVLIGVGIAAIAASVVMVGTSDEPSNEAFIVLNMGGGLSLIAGAGLFLYGLIRSPQPIRPTERAKIVQNVE